VSVCLSGHGTQGTSHSYGPGYPPSIWFFRAGHMWLGLVLHHRACRLVDAILSGRCWVRGKDPGTSLRMTGVATFVARMHDNPKGHSETVKERRWFRLLRRIPGTSSIWSFGRLTEQSCAAVAGGSARDRGAPTRGHLAAGRWAGDRRCAFHEGLGPCKARAR
jgi:hypothetical protein